MRSDHFIISDDDVVCRYYGNRSFCYDYTKNYQKLVTHNGGSTVRDIVVYDTGLWLMLKSHCFYSPNGLKDIFVRDGL